MTTHPPQNPSPSAPLRASAKWWGGRVFETDARGQRITFDAAGREGVAAMEGVLASLASCLGLAIANLLESMGTPFDGLDVRVSGREREDRPHALASVDVEVCLTRADRAKAKRAVALAASAHCSVSAMLRASGVDMRVRTVVVDPLATTRRKG